MIVVWSSTGNHVVITESMVVNTTKMIITMTLVMIDMMIFGIQSVKEREMKEETSETNCRNLHVVAQIDR